jgi:hypothetical protein
MPITEKTPGNQSRRPKEKRPLEAGVSSHSNPAINQQQRSPP